MGSVMGLHHARAMDGDSPTEPDAPSPAATTSVADLASAAAGGLPTEISGSFVSDHPGLVGSLVSDHPDNCKMKCGIPK